MTLKRMSRSRQELDWLRTVTLGAGLLVRQFRGSSGRLDED
jgi:hypothetical protein